MSDYCVAVQICRRMVYLFGTWFCESMCYLEQISYHLYNVIIWTFTIDISYCMSNVSIHIYLRQLLTEIYFSPTKIYRIFVHVFMSIPCPYSWAVRANTARSYNASGASNKVFKFVPTIIISRQDVCLQDHQSWTF